VQLKLRERKVGKMTREEIENFIIENYNSLSNRELIKITNCGQSNFYVICKRLGLSRNHHWTAEEDKFLIENYYDADWDFLLNHLGRNKDSIVGRASDLNIKRNFGYTEDEENYIRDNYGVLTPEEIANSLGKEIQSVYAKVSRMGICYDDSWADDEISRFIEVYPHYPNEYIVRKFFPNRTKAAIAGMARKLNIVKTEEKSVKFYVADEILERLIDLANHLGRTPSMTEIQSYGLPSEATYRRYFGSYRDACEKAGLELPSNLFGKPGCVYYSINGDRCFSKSEAIVTNFFIENNIPYRKEVFYSEFINDERCNSKRCDWVIYDNIFVEFFGLETKEYYLRKMEEKRKILEEYGIVLVELFRKDLSKLHKKFDWVYDNFVKNS